MAEPARTQHRNLPWGSSEQTRLIYIFQTMHLLHSHLSSKMLKKLHLQDTSSNRNTKILQRNRTVQKATPPPELPWSTVRTSAMFYPHRSTKKQELCSLPSYGDTRPQEVHSGWKGPADNGAAANLSLNLAPECITLPNGRLSFSPLANVIVRPLLPIATLLPEDLTVRQKMPH